VIWLAMRDGGLIGGWAKAAEGPALQDALRGRMIASARRVARLRTLAGNF